MKAHKIILAFLAMILAFGSYNEALEGASSRQLNVSYGAISGSMAPIWMAKEARFFEKQGLDLNLVYIPGGPRSVMSLLGGSVQFINHSAIPSLGAYLRGADTVLVGSPLNRLDHSLVVQPDIARVEELRGKTVGISSLGSLTDIVLREGLRLHGLSERDVTIFPAGDLGARLSALRTKKIHGALVSGVQFMAASKGGFKQLIDFSKLPILVAASGILSRRSYVLGDADTTLRFLKAWIEAIYFIKAKREVTLEVLRKYTRTEDPEVLDWIYNRYGSELSEKALPTVEVVQSMLRLVSHTSPEAQNANPDGFIEARFVKEIEKTGFFEEMSRKYPIGQKRD